MAYFSNQHVASDGLYYVYYWIKHADVTTLSKTARKRLSHYSMTSPILERYTYVIHARKEYGIPPKPIRDGGPALNLELTRRSKATFVRHRIKSAELMVGVNLDHKHGTMPADKFIDVYMLPPGTTLAQARKWIGSSEGKKWAVGGDCMLGQVSIDVLNRE